MQTYYTITTSYFSIWELIIPEKKIDNCRVKICIHTKKVFLWIWVLSNSFWQLNKFFRCRCFNSFNKWLYCHVVNTRSNAINIKVLRIKILKINVWQTDVSVIFVLQNIKQIGAFHIHSWLFSGTVRAGWSFFIHWTSGSLCIAWSTTQYFSKHRILQKAYLWFGEYLQFMRKVLNDFQSNLDSPEEKYQKITKLKLFWKQPWKDYSLKVQHKLTGKMSPFIFNLISVWHYPCPGCWTILPVTRSLKEGIQDLNIRHLCKAWFTGFENSSFVSKMVHRNWVFTYPFLPKCALDNKLIFHWGADSTPFPS